MKKVFAFTITMANFLEWAYETGYDDEQETEVKNLGEMVLGQLQEKGVVKISVKDLFEGNFELSIIPVKFTEQAKEFEDEDMEIWEVAEEFTIKLV